MAGRRAKRFRPAKTISVGFLGAGVSLTGDLVDLSTTGILIRCSEDLKLGTMGRLGIPVGHEIARIFAAARRSVPGVGVAFEFSHMSRRDRELLHRLLLRISSGLTP